MMKYVFAVLLVGVLGVGSAFAGNCHHGVQQVVVAQPVVHYVQPVRQTVVEVVDNHHFNNVQRVFVRPQVQRVVVANNHHNVAQVQKVVVANNNRVRVEKVVVSNGRGFFNGRSVQKSVVVRR